MYWRFLNSGRAVLHDHELTYSVVAPIEVLGASVAQSHEQISRAVVALGVSLAAFGRGGFLQEFTRDIRNIRNVWREGYCPKYINKWIIRSSNAQMSKHR